ncbi:MAG: NTP transferase domain-containing protein [Thermoanaerobacterales bacterium]|jgi:GTP:adenosylcobinamide-phosphate guanylyltransferase|nr:NTP transferase domain-containing protein [Thermoanaerobacterales bacterium]
MKAIILAGNKDKDILSDEGKSKALVKIHGKPMVLYVIEVVKQLDFIDKIAIVGDKNGLLFLKQHVDVIIEQGDSLEDNILRGCKYFDKNEDVLILTCDIPLITADAITDFVQDAKQLKADFCYPVVSREHSEKKYPGVHRTFVKLKDGTFTGGNIVLVNNEVIQQSIPKAAMFLAYRKKPWKLARILGLSFVIKFLLGSLTIAELEQKVSGIFGIKAKAVVSSWPEIGTDVDKKSDLVLAENVLAGRFINETK